MREAERRGNWSGLGHQNSRSRRDARAFAQRGELRPHDVLGDAALPAEVSKPQSVPACTRFGSPTASATRSMRSAIVFGCSTKLVTRIDHAGDDDLVGIERKVLQHSVFVRMARIGERQHEAADIQLAQDRHDLVQLHIAVVRAFVIAPARVQPDAVARDVDQRRIDGA